MTTERAPAGGGDAARRTTERGAAGRADAAGRTTERVGRPAPGWVFGGAVGVFFVALAVLAFQVRAGKDPALGPAAAPASAEAAAAATAPPAAAGPPPAPAPLTTRSS